MNPLLARKIAWCTVALWLLSVPVLTASAQSVQILPYIQPGDGRTLQGSDVKVIRWLTDQTPGNFTVEYRVGNGSLQSALPIRVALDFPLEKLPGCEPAKDKGDEPEAKKKPTQPGDANEPKEKDLRVPPLVEMDQHFYRYTAHLKNLPFNTDVMYRVKLSGEVVREAVFKTRPTADRSVRCVLVGDLAQGRKQQREIAYEISRQKPEFLVALGDIVYSTGRVSQYMAYFWDTYNNVAQAGPKTGAPLMATTTVYPVLGNHDVAAKLSRTSDALGAYYFFAPPQGGPGEGPWVTQIDGDVCTQAKFLAANRDSYPNLDAYSFDYGPAHFLVLNVNPAIKIESPEFLRWLRDDLQSSDATWKLVCFHMPAFHSSRIHYTEQQVRSLNPVFEECGVDITFAGHVHNYQRSVPLKFVPDPVRAEKRGKVEGTFTLDHVFDGVTKTNPRGVIHIVSGGGGASLYGPALDKTAPDLRRFYGANYADFTAKMIVDKHSFVTLDIAPDRLHLRAVGATGLELDAITITKKK